MPEKRRRKYREEGGTVQLNFEVEPDAKKRLKIEAARLGMSMQALGKAIIENAVKRYKE